MKSKTIFAVAAILSTLLLTQCTSRVGDFTVISTRNSNINNWQRAPERVSGKSCSWWLFIIVPIKRWSLKDAVEDAVDKYNRRARGAGLTGAIARGYRGAFNLVDDHPEGIQTEALLDVRLSTSFFTMIVFTRTCMHATGLPSDSWYETTERIDQIKRD